MSGREFIISALLVLTSGAIGADQSETTPTPPPTPPAANTNTATSTSTSTSTTSSVAGATSVPVTRGSLNPAKHGLGRLPTAPKVMIIPINDEGTTREG